MTGSGYRDYYKVLGIDRSAKAVDIKRAFRSKARKYHPDINPNNPEAENKFKEISEAYEVLSDPDKRKRYEEFGQYWNQRNVSDATSPFGQGVAVDFGGYGNFDEFINELLGRFTGGASTTGFSPNFSTSSQTSKKIINLDAKIQLQISFRESFFGTERTLVVNNEKIKIKIPKGIKSNSKLRVKGKGNIQSGSGLRGDLYLHIDVKSHPIWGIEGDDLCADLPVAIDELILGATIQVITPDGEAKIRIPKSTLPGQNLRLKGKGFPTINGRGDLIFTLKLKISKEWTSSELELIDQLGKMRSYDPRKDWFNSALI